MKTWRVRFPNQGLTFSCDAAETEFDRTRGLQGYGPLMPHEGLLFVFPYPGRPTFHMGTVSFPITIVWIGPDRRVTRVTDALPGDSGQWTAPAQYVLEVASGALTGVRVGDPVEMYKRTAQIFQDSSRAHGLPEEYVDGDSIDSATYEHQFGRTDAVENEDADAPRRVAQVDLEPREPELVDQGQMVSQVLAAAMQANDLNFQPDSLTNGQSSSAVVGRRDIRRWLQAVQVPKSSVSPVMQAVTSPEGWDALGDGFVGMGIATLARRTAFGLVLQRLQ